MWGLTAHGRVACGVSPPPLSCRVLRVAAGVEEAAVEVEQPYGMDFNDLPLDSITQGVYDSVHDMARIVRGQRAAGASGKARSEPVHVNGKNSYGDGSERISEV